MRLLSILLIFFTISACDCYGGNARFASVFPFRNSHICSEEGKVLFFAREKNSKLQAYMMMEDYSVVELAHILKADKTILGWDNDNNILCTRQRPLALSNLLMSPDGIITDMMVYDSDGSFLKCYCQNTGDMFGHYSWNSTKTFLACDINGKLAIDNKEKKEATNYDWMEHCSHPYWIDDTSFIINIGGEEAVKINLDKSGSVRESSIVLENKKGLRLLGVCDNQPVYVYEIGEIDANRVFVLNLGDEVILNKILAANCLYDSGCIVYLESDNLNILDLKTREVLYTRDGVGTDHFLYGFDGIHKKVYMIKKRTLYNLLVLDKAGEKTISIDSFLGAAVAVEDRK